MENNTQKTGLSTALRLVRRPRMAPTRPVTPPPVAPQQPANTGWNAAPRGQRDDQQPGMLNTRDNAAAAAKAKFEKDLKESTPLIHQAKAFALTVDGKRIELGKTQAGSDPEKGVAALSITLQADVKKVDGHTSEVRKAVEAKNYLLAEREFSAALKTAEGILLQKDAYDKLLTAAGVANDGKLAGEFTAPTAGERKYDERLELSVEAIEEAIAINSKNTTIAGLVAGLRKSYAAVQSQAEQGMFGVAAKALDKCDKEVETIQVLQRAALDFEENRAAAAPLISQLRTIKPTQAQTADHQAALDGYVLAIKQADDGKFADASRTLRTAREAAEQVLPAGGEDARLFGTSWADLKPRVEKAAVLPCDCRKVKSAQTELQLRLKEIEKFASDGLFTDAFDLLPDTSALVIVVQQLSQRWTSYLEQKENGATLVTTALNLKPTEKAPQELQARLTTARAAAETAAHAGEFGPAAQHLDNAVKLAEELLLAGGGKEAVSHYKDVESSKGLFAAANAVRPGCVPVSEAKAAFVEVYSEMQAAAADGDFDGADYSYGIAVSRADTVTRLQREHESLLAIQKSYAKAFDSATTADVGIPGVAAPQTRLLQVLAGIPAAIETDLGVALSELRTAYNFASQVNAVLEKQAKQASRKKDLDETLGQVAKTYLPPGLSQNMSRGVNQGDDPLWDDFLAAMNTAETAKTDANLDALAGAATAWLSALSSLTADLQDLPEHKTRKTQAQAALKQAKHLKLANKYAALGAPPWSQDQEDQAADLQMKVLFESGDKPMEKSGKGLFGAKWITTANFEDDSSKREFIFKPAQGPSGIHGFAKGSEPTREVLGDELGKLLKAGTGLDFNVPETRLVSIDSQKFHAGATPNTELKGSAQAGTPNIGSVGDFLDDPVALKKISPKAAQKAVIFDALALNIDRHADNYLVTPEKEDGTCELVPIDNGLAFPTREGLDSRRGRIAGVNAIRDIPAAYEPFDAESLAAIDMIDENAVVDGLKARTSSLDAQHPDLNVKAGVPDQTIDLIKRNIQFMKRAAPKVSPATLMDLIMENTSAIFDTPEVDKISAFDAVIKKGQERDAALGPLLGMSDAEKRVMYKAIFDLGWNNQFEDPTAGFGSGSAKFALWVSRNPKTAFDIYRSGKVNPEATAEIRKSTAEILALNPASNIVNDLTGKTVAAQLQTVQDQLASAKSDKRQLDLMAEYNKLFPKDPVAAPDHKFLAAFSLFLKYDGKAITEVDGKNVTKMSFSDRYKTVLPTLKAEEKRDLESVLATTAYKTMRTEIEKVSGYMNKTTTVDKAKEMLRSWEKLKKLGGLDAFVSFGGDCEALVGGPDAAVAYLEACKNTERVDVASL